MRNECVSMCTDIRRYGGHAGKEHMRLTFHTAIDATQWKLWEKGKTKIEKTGGSKGNSREEKLISQAGASWLPGWPLISLSAAACHQHCLIFPCDPRLWFGVILAVATAVITPTSYSLLNTSVELGTVLNALHPPPNPVRSMLLLTPFYRWEAEPLRC